MIADRNNDMTAKGPARRALDGAFGILRILNGARRPIAGWAAAAMLVAALALLALGPEYRATALIEWDAGGAADGPDAVLADAVLGSAAAELGLAPERLRRHVGIAADLGPRRLGIVARHVDPVEAARIANVVAGVYRDRREAEAGEAAERATADLAARIEESSRRVADSEAALASPEIDAGAVPAIRREMIAREVETNRSLVESFRARLRDLRSEERRRIAGVRVLAEADAEDARRWPPVLPIVLLAGLAGALGGGVVAFARAQRRNRLWSPEDLERATGLPCLAIVPALGRGFFASPRAADIVLDEPESAYAQAVGSLANGLLLSDVSQPPRIVVLTGEGADTLAAALARCAALGRRHGRVVLIDGGSGLDTVGRGKAWVEDYAARRADIDDLIGRDPRSGLHVARVRDPAMALRDPAFGALARSLTERFDLTVVGAPAATAAAEARLVAQFADFALAVAGWGLTPKDEAAALARRLIESGLRTGTVLIEADLDALLEAGDIAPVPTAFRRYYAD